MDKVTLQFQFGKVVSDANFELDDQDKLVLTGTRNMRPVAYALMKGMQGKSVRDIQRWSRHMNQTHNARNPFPSSRVHIPEPDGTPAHECA